VGGVGVSDWNAATTAGTVSTAALVVGGVALTTGVVLWAAGARRTPSSPAWWLAPNVGPGVAGLAAGGRL
jgi:hypothetical protein